MRAIGKRQLGLLAKDQLDSSSAKTGKLAPVDWGI